MSLSSCTRLSDDGSLAVIPRCSIAAAFAVLTADSFRSFAQTRNQTSSLFSRSADLRTRDSTLSFVAADASKR
jgi:hypothetical protein